MMKNENKWIPRFDPTVHLGHLINFVGIIFGVGMIYAYLLSDVRALKDENIRQDRYIEKIEITNQESVSKLADLQRPDLEKLRDDMNAWFMKLNDKLDSKQDKK
jgi:hypothetical protein